MPLSAVAAASRAMGRLGALLGKPCFYLTPEYCRIVMLLRSKESARPDVRLNLSGPWNLFKPCLTLTLHFLQALLETTDRPTTLSP